MTFRFSSATSPAAFHIDQPWHLCRPQLLIHSFLPCLPTGSFGDREAKIFYKDGEEGELRLISARISAYGRPGLSRFI
jgi:hypothetical protein